MKLMVTFSTIVEAKYFMKLCVNNEISIVSYDLKDGYSYVAIECRYFSQTCAYLRLDIASNKQEICFPIKYVHSLGGWI